MTGANRRPAIARPIWSSTVAASMKAAFAHSLTLTDIHSGWTECAALVVREQTLVVEGISLIRRQLPFALRGLDTDNDSVFINETLQNYCREHQLDWIRSRASTIFWPLLRSRSATCSACTRKAHIAGLAARPNRCLRAIIAQHHDQSVRRGSSVAMHVAESS